MSILDNLRDSPVIPLKSFDIMSSLHFNKSLPNMSQTFLSQLFWWRKLRKAKSVINSSNSFSNVCVIMKSEQSCVTQCFHSQTSVTPAVTFINRDEGLVSMQLMDRIMINDNELYSMGLSDYTSNHNFQSSPQSLELSPFKNHSEYCLEDQQWFYGSIGRQQAIEMLDNRPIGSFIIRYSMTQQNCFAMTLRVPNDYQMSGIAHYLILRTETNAYKIKVYFTSFSIIKIISQLF